MTVLTIMFIREMMMAHLINTAPNFSTWNSFGLIDEISSSRFPISPYWTKVQ